MRFSISIFLLLVFFNLTAQNRQKAFEINQQLGRGINYGNMFEAPGESDWGNPWQPEYAKIISDLGFNHVRIPIRWEPAERSLSIFPYTIQPAFLNRIKQVVDSALNNGLFAIINMHHHEDLFKYPDAQKSRFLAQWKQISAFFKDYPDSLVFEILNEPHGNITPQKWNLFAADALRKIREDSPGRVVLIGTPEYGGLGGLQALQIPDDENIILTVHYYNPFQFTHQGASWVGTEADEWLGTEWKDSEDERNVMRQEFAPLIAVSNQHHIPVHIGEFGAFSTADITSRKKWTTFLARYFEQQNWSWAYWEFSAGFGIYNPQNKTLNNSLVDALLHNEMPEPAYYEGTAIYTSDFQNNTNGWVLYKQGTGAGQISKTNNTLVISISNGSTETWHVQLVKNNISLKAGKKYRFSFKAKAESARNFNAYVGKSISPYSSYSGYNLTAVSDTFAVYTFIFDMNETDNTARLVFDLGKSNVNVTLADVMLEEIELVVPTNVLNFNSIKTRIYPNPASEFLKIENNDDFEYFALFDLQGKLISKGKLINKTTEIQTEKLNRGMYFILLSGNKGQFSTKIVKQ